MSWQFEFESPVGERVLRRYRSCTTFAGIWWCNDKKKFVPYLDDMPKGGGSHSPPIRTFKAFKRFLRKHKELQNVEVILCSRFVGHNITARFINN